MVFKSARNAAQQKELDNKQLIEQLQSELQLHNQRLQSIKSANQVCVES